MVVTSWGTGRKDYSINVEESVISNVRSHQSQEVSILEGTDLSAYSWLTIDVGDAMGLAFSVIDSNMLDEDLDHWMTRACLLFNANVLIKHIWGMMHESGAYWKNDEYVQKKYGYGHVCFDFGAPFYMSALDDMANGYYPAVYFLPGGYTIKYYDYMLQDDIAGD